MYMYIQSSGWLKVHVHIKTVATFTCTYKVVATSTCTYQVVQVHVRIKIVAIHVQTGIHLENLWRELGNTV